MKDILSTKWCQASPRGNFSLKTSLLIMHGLFMFSFMKRRSRKRKVEGKVNTTEYFFLSVQAYMIFSGTWFFTLNKIIKMINEQWQRKERCWLTILNQASFPLCITLKDHCLNAHSPEKMDEKFSIGLRQAQIRLSQGQNLMEMYLTTWMNEKVSLFDVNFLHFYWF